MNGKGGRKQTWLMVPLFDSFVRVIDTLIALSLYCVTLLHLLLFVLFLFPISFSPTLYISPDFLFNLLYHFAPVEYNSGNDLLFFSSSSLILTSIESSWVKERASWLKWYQASFSSFSDHQITLKPFSVSDHPMRFSTRSLPLSLSLSQKVLCKHKSHDHKRCLESVLGNVWQERLTVTLFLAESREWSPLWTDFFVPSFRSFSLFKRMCERKTLSERGMEHCMYRSQSVVDDIRSVPPRFLFSSNPWMKREMRERQLLVCSAIAIRYDPSSPHLTCLPPVMTSCSTSPSTRLQAKRGGCRVWNFFTGLKCPVHWREISWSKTAKGSKSEPHFFVIWVPRRSSLFYCEADNNTTCQLPSQRVASRGAKKLRVTRLLFTLHSSFSLSIQCLLKEPFSREKRNKILLATSPSHQLCVRGVKYFPPHKMVSNWTIVRESMPFFWFFRFESSMFCLPLLSFPLFLSDPRNRDGWFLCQNYSTQWM